jgi:hypothetical protein
MRVSTRNGVQHDDIEAGCRDFRRRSSAATARAFSLSFRLARAMAERELHYGWVVTGETFVVMQATAGAMGTPGVFVGPLQKEFGWSAADISGGLASASFTTL